jgi:hypothetical protein
MAKPTFRAFVRQNRRRVDAIGDFCRDARSDPGFPWWCRSWSPIERYLRDHGATEPAIAAGHRCFLLYRETVSEAVRRPEEGVMGDTERPSPLWPKRAARNAPLR